jgi:hypothetical protein
MKVPEPLQWNMMGAAYRVLIEGARNVDAIEEMRLYQGLWFKADEAYIRELSPTRCSARKNT